jgi:hypothetical protein
MGGVTSSRFQFDPSWQYEDKQERRKGKKITVRNETGRDALFAVYKVYQPPCLGSSCPVTKMVRHSARVFIAAEDEAPANIYFRPLESGERVLPGIRLYLYWALLPDVKDVKDKPSLRRALFEVQSEASKQPIDQRKILDLAAKYWPAARDYYAYKEFPPLQDFIGIADKALNTSDTSKKGGNSFIGHSNASPQNASIHLRRNPQTSGQLGPARISNRIPLPMSAANRFDNVPLAFVVKPLSHAQRQLDLQSGAGYTGRMPRNRPVDR